MSGLDIQTTVKNSRALENQLCHRWYRSVLAFPDHLVAKELLHKSPVSTLVLDPFVGTGTTCVESKLRGFRSVGIDAIPFYRFVTKTKTDWHVDPTELLDMYLGVEAHVSEHLKTLASSSLAALSTLFSMRRRELRTGQVSVGKSTTRSYVEPHNLAQAFAFREAIEKIANEQIRDKLLLALGGVFVTAANVSFGPEISLTASKGRISIAGLLRRKVQEMSMDLQILRNVRSPRASALLGDSRRLDETVDDRSVDLVVTSPPYPVDKDYTRQARLELVLLGFVTNVEELQLMKKRMLRSSTRQIYTGDEDYTEVKRIERIQALVRQVRRRSARDNDTSGFSKMYPRLLGNYFGGMSLHFKSLYKVLRRGGHCAYVVGDSRSFKQVHIETSRILALLAKRTGFRVDSVELWQTRSSSRLGKPLPEHVIRFSKP